MTSPLRLMLVSARPEPVLSQVEGPVDGRTTSAVVRQAHHERLVRLLGMVLLGLCWTQPTEAAPVPDSKTEWARFARELTVFGLPSRFLRLLPPDFVTLEFAELRGAAAEYHPAGHRMIFSRALSDGGQGRGFRPLREIGNQDLATIYHELFHAYFDYIDYAAETPRMPAEAARLHAEARRLLACRYTLVDVDLGPHLKAPQRKVRVEPRRLSESEGWEALNETWGVFVGWAVWNKLEATDRFTRRWEWERTERFLDRLEEAYQAGLLTGYFEPAAVEARRAIPRWYLAPTSAISLPEIALLLEVILDESPAMAQIAVRWIASENHAERSC
jgi:hypothetical protein